MEKFELAISIFISKMGYLLNDDVLGIVLYGSYTTGYSHNKSDIDLHIIMRNEVKELIRGSLIENGFKIEYFEKPIHDLYESADNDFDTQNNALLPIIGHGIILFDRSGAIGELQRYIIKKYSQPLPPLTNDDAKEMAVILDNRITQLQIMLDNDRPEFNHNYHLVIEKIRKFYSGLCGCPDIPVAKAFKIYSNENYRKSFCKGKIPDEEFIRLYFDAATCEGTKKDKMAYAIALYNYATRDLNLNPNDYRIMIKSRNNPMNKIHEWLIKYE